MDELFCRFSPPEQLHSDQGRQFESILMKELCKSLHINKTHTTPYHPQGDGLVERFNWTLLDMLATTCKNNPFDWDKHIRKVCMAYNSSVHSSTGYTPFFLMFGRQARLPVDLMYGVTQNQTDSPSEFVKRLKSTLEQAYALCRNKANLTHQHQKEFYDQRIHGNPFQQGDLVWLHSPVIRPGASKKLHHPWQGPYRVIKRLSDSTYWIQTAKGVRKRHIVHFDRLKPCHPDTRIELDQSPLPTGTPPDNSTTREHHAGDELNVIDAPVVPPTASRYPTRHRCSPDWLTPHITH